MMHYVSRYIKFAPPLFRKYCQQSITGKLTTEAQIERLKNAGPHYRKLVNRMQERIKASKDLPTTESSTLNAHSMEEALKKEQEFRHLSIY